MSGWYILDIARYAAFTSPSVAPSLSPSILNESYLTLPTFAAIQSLSLCSARCGGGSLSRLGEGGGGGACCRRCGGDPGGGGGFELDDWFGLVLLVDRSSALLPPNAAFPT